MKQTNKLHYKYVETNKVYHDNVNNIYFILFISTTYGHKWKLHFEELNDFHSFHCLFFEEQWIANSYCTIVTRIHKIIIFIWALIRFRYLLFVISNLVFDLTMQISRNDIINVQKIISDWEFAFYMKTNEVNNSIHFG